MFFNLAFGDQVACFAPSVDQHGTIHNPYCGVPKGYEHQSIDGLQAPIPPIHNLSVEFARVWEASLQWSLQVNILEVRADSGFYRVLLKLGQV